MAAPTGNRELENIGLDKVREARAAFSRKHAEVTPERYDARDLEKLRSCDVWVKLYLLHQKQNIDSTIKMMDSSLSWRKEMNVLDIHEGNFKSEDLQKGAVYYHSKDKNGHPILYFRASELKKEAEALQVARRTIAMLLERNQRTRIGHTIVTLLDLTGVRMTNVDLDLIKYIITCFTTYYPAMIEYMLIYDMPWIVSAIWTIVKQLLSEEEQKHVIFAKKATVQEYIKVENLWKHMGGTDDYIFRYKPWIEPGTMPPVDGLDADHDDSCIGDELRTVSLALLAGSGEAIVDVLNGPQDMRPRHGGRRVNFTDADEVQVFSSFREDQGPEASSDCLDGAVAKHQETLVLDSDYSQLGTLILDPPSEIVFARSRPEDEGRTVLYLRNSSNLTMLYKVKTTHPQHYRVKPSHGRLRPSATDAVQIVLLPGKSLKGDKFLVQFGTVSPAAVVGASTMGEASPPPILWSMLSKESIHERRLQCVEGLGSLPTVPVLTGSAIGHDRQNASIVPSQAPLLKTSVANKMQLHDSPATISENTEIRQQIGELKANVGRVLWLTRMNTALLLVLIAFLVAHYLFSVADLSSVTSQSTAGSREL